MKKVLLLIMFTMLFVSCNQEEADVILVDSQEELKNFEVPDYAVITREATEAEITLVKNAKKGLQLKSFNPVCSGYDVPYGWGGNDLFDEDTTIATYVVVQTTLDGTVVGTFYNAAYNKIWTKNYGKSLTAAGICWVLNLQEL